MKKHKILICLLIIILIAVTFTACKPKEVETENSNNVDSSFVSDVLCAKPVAPNGNETKILDSYTDNKYNYYLLDAGYIKNVFISTLAQVEYTGAPISFSKSITSTSQVAKSLTETVSNSYYFSNSYSEKTSIAAEETFKAGFDGLGVEFTAKQGLEWEWSESSSQTTTKSAANTSETVKIYSDAQTVSYSFGVNMAAKGRYRYAIYSDCDVYYRVKTSTDRQTLYGIDVDVCARVEDYFIRSEYSKDGNFKVKVEEGKNYKLSIKVEYNLSNGNSEGDEECSGSIEFKKLLNFNPNYNFEMSDIKTYRLVDNELVETTEFDIGEEIIVKFNATTSTVCVPAEVVINGIKHTLEKQDNTYRIDSPLLYTVGSGVLKL